MKQPSSHVGSPHTIYIVSGGVGASGEQLVNTVLAQFPHAQVKTITISNVRFEQQLDEVIHRARLQQATLVHTLVAPDLRAYLIRQAARQAVPAVDLMGALLVRLEQVLGQTAVGQPGLYRQLHEAYYDRVAAIEYTIAHDDGQRAEDWSQAEIVITGVSRVGKTPLSLYLSVLGWKVANIPLVEQLGIPEMLLSLDRQRVFGLTLAPAALLAFRQQRQQRLGTSGPSDYTNPEKIFEELHAAEKIFRSAGFRLIDATDKPIETTADEIIRLVSQRKSR